MELTAARRTLALLALTLLFPAHPARAEQQKQRAAVLEFELADGVKKIDRTYLSDRTRTALQDAAPQLFIMTRESTEMLLQANGKSLADCTGECEVEVGRKLGADYIVSGRITQFGTRISVTMRLFSTADGQLLSSAEARGETLNQLQDAMDGALAKLVAPLAGRAQPAPAATAPNSAAAQAPASAPAENGAPQNPAAPPPAAPGKDRVDPKTNIVFTYIPGATFHVGCEAGDKQCEPAENPGRTATVPAFWMAKNLVTLANYQKCLQSGACSAPFTGNMCVWSTGKNGYPINCIDFSQAHDFCAWIGARLPTAEEWELAAKGGGGRIYPWGNQKPTDKLAKFNGTDGPSPIGYYPDGASKQGLLDMAGNLWEWTTSFGDRAQMELHGGSWDGRPRAMRASAKIFLEADARYDSVGFRCAL